MKTLIAMNQNIRIQRDAMMIEQVSYCVQYKVELQRPAEKVSQYLLCICVQNC